jgi:hypothetical protein
MIAMQIPEEFYDFCLYLHQDSMVVYGSKIEDVISGALQHMDKERRANLRKYISQLLAGEYSDTELQEIYRATDAELGIRNENGIRHFLALVRDTIDQNISR